MDYSRKRASNSEKSYQKNADVVISTGFIKTGLETNRPLPFEDTVHYENLRVF
jgi:hypothetical protein